MVNPMTLTALPGVRLYPRHPGQLFLAHLATLMLLLGSPNGFAETYKACVEKHLGKSYTPEKAHSKCKYHFDTQPPPAAGKKAAKARQRKDSRKNRE